MRVELLTKEYPPNIYGGAGVHVAELVRALRADAVTVKVRAFGSPAPEADTIGYAELPQLASANATLQTLGVDLQIAADCADGDLVHSHTWYANMAGHLAGLLHDLPHVITAHSLEPLRPWKAEQLGGGYQVSSFVERTAFEAADAVIAVSAAMRADVLTAYPKINPARVHVVHNGIDAAQWQRDTGEQAQATVREYGLDPDAPSVIFVGRITRQKGLPYLLQAVAQLPPQVQLIFCAGAPDTAQIMAEVEELVAQLRAERDGVVWITDMLPRAQIIGLLSAATVFVCPSVYEPLGIVNLEAMACEVAVVGTATGGIPEVVDDGVTGWLVPIEQATDGTGTPTDPAQFVSDLARVLNDAVRDPAEARRRGVAGRERAVNEFGWAAIADKTKAVYQQVIDQRASR